ncbi:MAG: hypothetical protein V2I33_14560 [Kangiellaceae bacterium]|jgi:hypothetical protein|nr:hypothetical protein [Kangiellaceae bacterium]
MINIEFTDNFNGVHIAMGGDVRAQELLEIKHQICREEKLPQLKYQLFDSTLVENYWITLDDIKQFARVDLATWQINPDIATLIVSPNKAIDTWASIWQDHIGDNIYQTERFSSKSDALSWIKAYIN